MLKTKTITSINNPIIKEIVNLKRNSNKFLLISKNVIKEAIKNGFIIDTLIIQQDKFNSIEKELINSVNQILLVSNEIVKKINTTTKYNFIFALANKKTKTNKLNIDFKKDKNIIILENVQNPENVGSIIRTTLGLGANKLLLYNCVSIYNEKVISSSAGNLFNNNVVEINSIDVLNDLKKNNYEIIITDLSKKSKNIESIQSQIQRKNKVIVFGNEGTGVSEKIKNLSTTSIKIEMKNNVDSFNVAISAAIISYLLIK